MNPFYCHMVIYLCLIFHGIVSAIIEKEQDYETMCGIYGLAYSDPAQTPATIVLDQMAKAIFHRGPHGREQGVALVGRSGPDRSESGLMGFRNVAFRRLAFRVAFGKGY